MKQDDKAFIKGTSEIVIIESDEFELDGEKCYIAKSYVGSLSTTHTLKASGLEPIEEEDCDGIDDPNLEVRSDIVPEWQRKSFDW